MIERSNTALHSQDNELNLEEFIEELLGLYNKGRGKKLEELNDEQLKSLAQILVKMAKERGNIVSQMLESEPFMKKTHPGALKLEIIRQLSVFKVKRENLALDIEDDKFESIHEKINAIIDDINQRRIPAGRLHELLHHNIFEKEEVIDNETGEVIKTAVKSRTLLSYALTKFIPAESEIILGSIRNNLGKKQFRFYIQTPNCLGSGKLISAHDLLFRNYGLENQQEREDITKAGYSYGIKQLIQINDLNDTRNIVDINNINTHNTSSNKTADESHVTAFHIMIEKEKLESLSH